MLQVDAAEPPPASRRSVLAERIAYFRKAPPQPREQRDSPDKGAKQFWWAQQDSSPSLHGSFTGRNPLAPLHRLSSPSRPSRHSTPGDLAVHQPDTSGDARPQGGSPSRSRRISPPEPDRRQSSAGGALDALQRLAQSNPRLHQALLSLEKDRDGRISEKTMAKVRRSSVDGAPRMPTIAETADTRSGPVYPQHTTTTAHAMPRAPQRMQSPDQLSSSRRSLDQYSALGPSPEHRMSKTPSPTRHSAARHSRMAEQSPKSSPEGRSPRARSPYQDSTIGMSSRQHTVVMGLGLRAKLQTTQGRLMLIDLPPAAQRGQYTAPVVTLAFAAHQKKDLQAQSSWNTAQHQADPAAHQFPLLTSPRTRKADPLTPQPRHLDVRALMTARPAA
ncbi:hypothetical protein WJX72_006845 [[Myrmecia] bisecta]|uniref:Uncharacterized protein n=1 Tax=[Myrmecia] bisecta TaxID=41462 RepID=A0AAW1Q063_9CHLO